MSDLEIHSILCDHGEECVAEPPFLSSVLSVTRAEAAKAGWTRGVDGEDFCPEHAPSKGAER